MSQSRIRVASVDLLRGGVMVIMALDHVRDFVNRSAQSSSPTDLAATTPALFLTRWITHFCAPVFVFTAGLGAWFYLQRGRDRRDLSRFLLTRGLWLMVLEMTVMRVAYQTKLLSSAPLFLLVLWVLGLSMVGLALLIWLPLPAVAVLSVGTIVLHNLLDGVSAASLGGAAPLWNVLHQPGAISVGGVLVIIGYPLVPWIAVMSLGFCTGRLFEFEPGRRRRILYQSGIAASAAYLLLRGINGYGDPSPWTTQASPLFTALSFLNTTKYPPSLDFLLMTLGPALIMLAWADARKFDERNPLIVFGRVPLFYYVAHFFAAHLAAVLLAFVRYGARAGDFALLPVPSMGGPADRFPDDFGYGLLATYVVWIAIVAVLYPVCRWYAAVKQRRRDWWLSYL
jgi:uncharacterized membrane protein